MSNRPHPDTLVLPSPQTRDRDAWIWRPRADFAPWLREQRRLHQLTLKVAAERLGVTLTRLHKLETGGRVRAPSLELIAGIAALYGREIDDVIGRAGFRMELPAELRDAARCDETFAALVLHPALRPACMDERWVESYSRIQKAQWVEFARRLLELARGGGVTMEGIVGEGDSGGARVA